MLSRKTWSRDLTSTYPPFQEEARAKIRENRIVFKHYLASLPGLDVNMRWRFVPMSVEGVFGRLPLRIKREKSVGFIVGRAFLVLRTEGACRIQNN